MSFKKLLLTSAATFLGFMALFSPQEACAERIIHDHFIIHAIPKCGTHCIERAINLLTDQPLFHRQLSDDSLTESENEGKILRIFEPYNKQSIKLLLRRHFKVVSMYRDPRDALISHLFYMRKLSNTGRKRDFFIVSANFDELSQEEQLTALITGTEDMESYLAYFHKRIGWAKNGYSHGVKYEDLVGSEGGGDDKLQEQAIVNIANYINMPLSQKRLKYVINNLYQKIGLDREEEGGLVFTRSEIGNWKTFFTEEQKRLFKEKFGSLLIELGYEKNQNW